MTATKHVVARVALRTSLFPSAMLCRRRAKHGSEGVVPLLPAARGRRCRRRMRGREKSVPSSVTRFLSASALALAIAFPAAAHSIVDVSVDQRGPAYVAANATLTYTVVVTDLAYDFSYGVVMTDVLPSGATFKSASGSGWNCTQSKG